MENPVAKSTVKGASTTVTTASGESGAYPAMANVSFWIVSALLLIMGFTLAFHEVRDLDVGFHLKAGDWILQNMQFPGKDVFTYTINHRDYIDLYWLYQVVLSIANSIGGAFAIVALHASLVVLNYVMIIRRARQLGTVRTLSYGLVLFVAMYAASYHFNIRPHIFSWTFMNLMFLTLESYYRDRSVKLWPLPAIMLVWANCHTLFVLGWGLMFFYLMSIWFHEGKLDRNFLKYSVAAVVICLINPYFFKGIMIPIEQFFFLQEGSLFKELISEYRSPFSGGIFSNYFVNEEFVLFQPTFFFHLFIVMTVVAAAVKWVILKDRRLHDILIVVTFTAIMAMAFKNIGYFVMAVTPFTINGIGYLFALRQESMRRAVRQLRFARKRESPVLAPAPAGTVAWVHAVVAVVTLVATARVVSNAYYVAWRSRDVVGYEFSTNNMPVVSAKFIRDNGLDGRILNHINFGGIYQYYLPQQVFIDARNEIIGEEFFREYRQMNDSVRRPRLLRKYNPNIVAFPPRVELRWHEYFRVDSNWRLVLADDISAVYLRKGYAEQIPAIDSVSILRQQKIPVTPTGAMDDLLRQRKEPGFFETLFNRQYYPHAEVDLCSFCLNNKWYSTAVQVGLEGLRRSTVDATALYYNLGQGYIRMGDYPRAKYCYERYLETHENPKLDSLVIKLTKVISNRQSKP